MLEVFFDIFNTLKEMRDLMISMNGYLKDLTMPPDMVAWAKKIKEVDKNE
jgi:hypothetical protein